MHSNNKNALDNMDDATIKTRAFVSTTTDTVANSKTIGSDTILTITTTAVTTITIRPNPGDVVTIAADET